MALDPEKLADWRLRASQGSGMCLAEHTIHRNDHEVWICCGEEELGRLVVEDRPTRFGHDDVRFFVNHEVAVHNQQAAAQIVLELLDEIEALQVSG